MSATPILLPPALRCLTVWLAATAAAGSAAWLVLPVLHATGQRLAGPGSHAEIAFPVLLEWLAAVVLVGCAVWFWLVTTLVVGSAVRGRLPARIPGCPPALHRALLAGCGLALAGGLAAPAGADEPAPDPARPAAAQHAGSSIPVRRVGAESLLIEGLRLPERAAVGFGRRVPSTVPATVADVTGPRARSFPRQDRATAGHREDSQPPPDARPGTSASGDRARVLVVRPGDTLWDLTDAMLPAGAPEAAIADRWPRLYRLNRTVIGADPDLILPGQRLRLPGAERSPHG